MEKFDWIAPMGTNLFMLKIAGMWPLGGTYTANVYAFYTVTCILLFIYGHNFFQTFNIFFILDDMTAVTATIFVALTDLIAIIKTHSMMANVTTLKQILVDINVNMFKPRNEQQKVLVERRIRLWKTVYGLFCFMAFFTILFWGFILSWTAQSKSIVCRSWRGTRTTPKCHPTTRSPTFTKSPV
jgi:hypothetical protein